MRARPVQAPAAERRQPRSRRLADVAEADQPDSAVRQIGDALEHHLLLALDLASLEHAFVAGDDATQETEHEHEGLLGNRAGVAPFVVANVHAPLLRRAAIDSADGHAFGMDHLERRKRGDEPSRHRRDGVDKQNLGIGHSRAIRSSGVSSGKNATSWSLNTRSEGANKRYLSSFAMTAILMAFPLSP